MEVDFMKFPPHVREVIYNAVPGMTGVGSIIFRDEEKWVSAHEGDKHEFYRNYIAPYKGELELWYLEHISFRTDFMLVFLTAWVILFPRSGFVYKIFRDLPARPQYLD
jgi:lipopolysaccharide/colanic/teichoic acid biosynthesis glycosyltransferase